MERVLKNLMLVLILAAATPSAMAGVVLAPPPAPEAAPGPGESYPESSFGQAPAHVDVTREVDTMDAGNRKPAGLVFQDGQPVIPPPQMKPDFHEAQAQAAEKPGAPELAGAIRRNGGVQEVALIAGDLGFFPKTVFVSPDVPVRMFVTGASKQSLCIMMDSFQVKKQVRSQRIEEINFTPSSPGKYRFYCPVNGMEGTMIVREIASSSTATGGANAGE
ncbi:MAG: cupredoxin domain-containing protein [Bdellovibrionota bacterium]